MQLLESVKGALVKNIVIDVEADKMNSMLQSIINEKSTGEGTPSGELSFRVFDPSINRSLKLSSARRIHITRDLVEALDGENISYSINE